MVPQDPIMLLSFLNLKLRDYGKNLEEICDDLELSVSEVTEKLAALDYHYDEEKNQFV